MRKRTLAILRDAPPHGTDGATPLLYNASMMAELVGLIAHEINQPLSGILSSAGAGLRWLKRDTPDLTEIERNLQDIRKSVQRADAIIRELRALVDHVDASGAAIGLEPRVATISNNIASDPAGDGDTGPPGRPIVA